jgi:CheY-like chemotaxis protein
VTPPDVVLLDIGLPGMDGWELARLIRTLPGLRRPLLVAITSYGQEADRERSRQAGIHVHFLKPVDPVELAQLLQRFQVTRSSEAPAKGLARSGRTEAPTW